MSGEIAEAADQILELTSSSRFRECVCRHAGLSPALTPNFKFHPQDQMLLHSLRAFDASTALSQYFSVAIQQYRAFRQVLEALAVHEPSCRLLDFACGFGRLLRFATLQKTASEIWASEI